MNFFSRNIFVWSALLTRIGLLNPKIPNLSLKYHTYISKRKYKFPRSLVVVPEKILFSSRGILILRKFYISKHFT
jgi:hypothetical protein